MERSQQLIKPTSKYTYEQKVDLSKKISKIKSKEDLVTIYNIIIQDVMYTDSNQTINTNGVFMSFNKLSDDTYKNIEKEIKRLRAQHKLFLLSESNNDTVTSNTSIADSSELSDPTSTEIAKPDSSTEPKLRLSNRERNLLKRRSYDKHININSPNNIEYRTFEFDDKQTNNINSIQPVQVTQPTSIKPPTQTTTQVTKKKIVPKSKTATN